MAQKELYPEVTNIIIIIFITTILALFILSLPKVKYILRGIKISFMYPLKIFFFRL